jgi:hypothetical protein
MNKSEILIKFEKYRVLFNKILSWKVPYLAHGTLNVSDDGAVGIVKKLDSDLSYVTGVAGAAKDLVNLRELDAS